MNIHQQEIALANKDPYNAKLKFTTEHGTQGVTNKVFENYVKSYDGLSKHYDTYWKQGAKQGRTQDNKGISMSEFGAMHWVNHGMKEGRSLDGPRKAPAAPATVQPAPTPVSPQTKALEQQIKDLTTKLEEKSAAVAPAVDAAKAKARAPLDALKSTILTTPAGVSVEERRKRSSLLGGE